MRLLIVEDEPRLLRTLARSLREEGYAVDTAAAGDVGLYKAESHEYDAIVLELILPRQHGRALLPPPAAIVAGVSLPGPPTSSPSRSICRSSSLDSAR